MNTRYVNNLARFYLNWHPDLDPLFKVSTWSADGTRSIDIDFWKLSIVIRWRAK